MLWKTIVIALVVIFIWDIFQKKHALLRTYPVIGHIRYLGETLGIFLRAFFYERDNEGFPFNRSDRTWVYRAAKMSDTTIGFGSTRNPHPVGTIYFVSTPFPVLNRAATETRAVTIGPFTQHPYTTKSLINISAMSYGAISKAAIRALGMGAKKAGCWLNTGEGGVSPYHLESGCDLVAQIGTAKFGFCDANGNLSDAKLKEMAAYEQIKMFEIKLSQGAKPGKGGILPAKKITKEIAEIRNISMDHDAISPNRFPEIANASELLDFINHVRDVTQKPTGFKVSLGEFDWLDDLCQEILKRGKKFAPDFITLDGAEGGTGAAPMSLVDYMGHPIAESLPVLVDKLVEFGLRERIKVIASGKLITPDMVVWALAVGADFVNSARGFMFALGCIQALQCHLNTCPTGIATHNPWLEHGLDPHDKAIRVYNYVKTLEHEVGILCHSCGVHEPRELQRKHVRIVSDKGTSVSLAELYPDRVCEHH
jgi:glutamate synthase domain-containing protein 2